MNFELTQKYLNGEMPDDCYSVANSKTELVALIKELEYARPDHFFNPYCGKAYERTDVYGNVRVLSTEILSMGVERLVINPVRFLQEDREYATMCLNLIRGNL